MTKNYEGYLNSIIGEICKKTGKSRSDVLKEILKANEKELKEMLKIINEKEKERKRGVESMEEELLKLLLGNMGKKSGTSIDSILDAVIKQSLVEKLLNATSGGKQDDINMKDLLMFTLAMQMMKQPQQQAQTQQDNALQLLMLMMLGSGKGKSEDNEFLTKVLEIMQKSKTEEKEALTKELIDMLKEQQKKNELEKKIEDLKKQIEYQQQLITTLRHSDRDTRLPIELEDTKDLPIRKIKDIKADLEELGIIKPKSEEERKHEKEMTELKNLADLKKTELTTTKEILQESIDKVDKKVDALLNTALNILKEEQKFRQAKELPPEKLQILTTPQQQAQQTQSQQAQFMYATPEAPKRPEPPDVEVPTNVDMCPKCGRERINGICPECDFKGDENK